MGLNVPRRPAGLIPTKKCKRCGLSYDASRENCTHCSGMSVAQAKRFGNLYRFRLRRENLPMVRVLLCLIILTLTLWVIVAN
jgi:ribosomal protein L37E